MHKLRISFKIKNQEKRKVLDSVDVELCEVGCHTLRLIQANSGKFEIFRKTETCLILFL